LRPEVDDIHQVMFYAILPVVSVFTEKSVRHGEYRDHLRLD
jgi:hypothetical protein